MESYKRQINFDMGWKFIKGDIQEAQAPEYDDSNWREINVPHDWSIEGPFNEKNVSGRSGAFLPRGIGWYRKHFKLPRQYKDKLISIEFDGIYQNSEVWVNGVYLGKRPYGYVAFFYDLTPYIRFDENNVLAVRVDNSQEPNSRWYPGSGIYRHVWLHILDKLHIRHWGICVTTPRVSKDNALLVMEIEVENMYREDIRECHLKTEIINDKGEKVGEVTSTKSLKANQRTIFHQEYQLFSPQLWSVESPILYSMRNILMDREKVVDTCVTQFGVRSFKFDKKEGFTLNGKPMKLQGVNLHNDAGCLGTAVPDKVLERRLKILKEMGCNAIRTSHNPPARELLDMCDAMGFLVIDEAFDKWHSGYYGKVFDEWWQRDLEAMLLRDRNHPSIILWSVGNEVEDQGSDHMIETLKLLVDYVHKKEPTRPVTCALAPQSGSSVMEKVKTVVKMSKAMDILSCNYHEPFYELYKNEDQNIIILGSEIYSFFRGTLENHKAFDNKNPWFDVINNDYVVGGFVWSGIDYLGEAQPWPSKGWSAGLIDTCGFKKPRAYFFESMWSRKPMVHIAVFDDRMETNPEKLHWNWPKIASHWTFPYFENDIVRLVTFTNCEEVELFVNGVSKGIKRLSDYPDHMIIWYVPYEKGSIKAVGRISGNAVCIHGLHTADEPAKVRLTADREILVADGQDILHVKVEVIDKNGILVPYAENEITYNIVGYGRIIGIDNGDLCSNELYQAPHRRVYRGRALVIIQSTQKEGSIELVAESNGLESDRLIIEVKKK